MCIIPPHSRASLWSLLATLEPGNKSLSDSSAPVTGGALSAPPSAVCQSLSSPSLPRSLHRRLSMPQLKLHSSQSSFQDNKFDARRSSLCAGVFTQICRCRGAAARIEIRDISLDEYQDQKHEYQQEQDIIKYFM